MNCTKCGGTGIYNYPPETCWVCRGSGIMPSLTCGRCNGSGKTTIMVPKWDPEEEHMEENYIEVPCTGCNGTGQHNYF